MLFPRSLLLQKRKPAVRWLPAVPSQLTLLIVKMFLYPHIYGQGTSLLHHLPGYLLQPPPSSHCRYKAAYEPGPERLELVTCWGNTAAPGLYQKWWSMSQPEALLPPALQKEEGCWGVLWFLISESPGNPTCAISLGAGIASATPSTLNILYLDHWVSKPHVVCKWQGNTPVYTWGCRHITWHSTWSSRMQGAHGL